MSHNAGIAGRVGAILEEEPYLSQDEADGGSPRNGDRSREILLARLLAAREHFDIPMSRMHRTAEECFRELADQWKRESRLLSSTTEMSMLPSYQQIIGLGPAALPCILDELEQEAQQHREDVQTEHGVDEKDAGVGEVAAAH
mgnify:CR=1 FL=1